MKNNLTQKQIREIVAQLYWQGHEEGRIVGKRGKTDFGLANVSIEAAAIRLGCRPIKPERDK